MAETRVCPKCGKSWSSADTAGNWVCGVCGETLRPERKLLKGGDIKPMIKVIPKTRLALLRSESKLTLEEVSKLTGYDVSTISKHESSTRGLTDEAITKYSRLYKVETHKLFDIDCEEVN